jgi:hypothetical protein
MWNGFDSSYGLVTVTSEHGCEPLGSKKGG